MGDLEKGLDDSSDPARLSTSSDAEEHTRPQSPQQTPDPNALPNGDPSVPYGPQSIIVDWDGPDDPEHPQNWPYKKKWIITMVFVRITHYVVQLHHSSQLTSPPSPRQHQPSA